MNFSKQVGRFASNTERKMSLVFKDSAKAVADRANTPQAKGGRLPVDTGALRASIRAAIGSMPSGSSDEVTAGIARWTPGDTLYIGWTQSYAIYMEWKYAYMRGAAEKWPQIVRDAVKRR